MATAKGTGNGKTKPSSGFDNVRTVVASPRAQAKAVFAKNIKNWELIALIRAIQTNFKQLCETVEEEAKTEAKREFIEEGCAKQQRPGSFDVQDGIASGKVILSQRRSDLGIEQLKVDELVKYGVSHEVVRKVERCLRINPAITNDPALSRDIYDKFKKVKGLPMPLDEIFEWYESEPTVVVTKTSLDEVFRLKNVDAATRERLMDIVGQVSFKPTIDEIKGKDAITALQFCFDKAVTALNNLRKAMVH